MDERRYIIKLLEKVQVNVPFLKLKNDYFPLSMEYGMNPEIGIDAGALDSVSDKEFGNIAEILKINKRKITLHGPFINEKGLSPIITLEPHEEETLWQSLTSEDLKNFIRTLP